MSITLTTVILFAVFGVLLFLGVPISISIVVSSIVTAMSTLSWDQITFITMQKMNSGVESFSLLAVPLFILAGNIMNNGGIAKRLVNFAQLFVGKIPGSMAQANILGNMLFGALSGSSVAAASAMGGCISPIEEENGYDPAYSAAANIASAPTGLLIPPTSAFIVYSTVAGGVSISTLFMAGYGPGILMGLCCMLVAFIGAKKAGMKATGYDKSKSIGKTIWDAVPSLLLIVIVIGGIVNEYIHVEKPDQEAVPSRQFDISKIDFELLSREFAHTRRKNLLMRDLDELVNQQLAKMLFANPQRIDYYDRYQEIIDAYNAEQNRATIEKTFMDLMELASSLDTEQQRYVREGFSSDEELSVYDLLFSENLTKQEIETIKKVSVDLLTKIKQQIAKLDHWTDKQETKAIVDNLIRNTLWQELPNSYDVSDIQTYQKKIYEYVYMRYPEVA